MMMKAEDFSKTSIHIYELYGFKPQTIMIVYKNPSLKFRFMHDTCNSFPSIFQSVVSIVHSDAPFFMDRPCNGITG
jgi:hypothetical protein